MNHPKALPTLLITVLLLIGAIVYAVATQAPSEGTPGDMTATTTPGMVGIGQSITIQGVTITPLEVVEDSRCPGDVQCIQAGRLRIRAAINAMNRDFTFTLGEAQIILDKEVTLTGVVPSEKHSQVTVSPADYRFTFTVGEVSATGIRGTVLLGPTCPVERNPPDPKCADKGYATTVTIIKAGAANVTATVKSSADGSYALALAPGTYTVTAGSGSTLPRCAIVTTVVSASGYASADIACDSGIR